jgi:hypothetical protein
MPHSQYHFYVYLLLDPDRHPFYVGKGSGGRILDHEREAKNGHDCPKCDAIRAIWQAGGQVGRAIVFETDDEREVLQQETALIAHYGLQNLTNKGPRGPKSKGRRIQTQSKHPGLIPDFQERLLRHGYSLRRFCEAFSIPHSTIYSALHPQYFPNRKGGFHNLTAWRIARAYAKLTAQSEEAAYQEIIIDPRSASMGSDEKR